MDVRVVVGDLPEPEKNPLAEIYRKKSLILVLQEEGDAATIIRKAHKRIKFPYWKIWMGKFEDPLLDPYLSWINPEKYIPDKYWNYRIIPSAVPPALQVGQLIKPQWPNWLNLN